MWSIIGEKVHIFEDVFRVGKGMEICEGAVSRIILKAQLHNMVEGSSFRIGIEVLLWDSRIGTQQSEGITAHKPLGEVIPS